MRMIGIVPAAIAAALALQVSAAFSQEACIKDFQVCMDQCGSRSSKQNQDACYTSCHTRNDSCAERVFGKRPVGGATVASPKTQAKDAMAKKTDAPAPAAAPVEPAAAPEPSQAEPEQPAPAPRRR